MLGLPLSANGEDSKINKHKIIKTSEDSVMGIKDTFDKFKKGGVEDETIDEMYGSDMYDDYGYGYDDGSAEAGADQDYGGYQDSMGASGMGSSYNNSNPTGGISIGGASLEMKVVKPENFDSVPQIADHLLNKCTVVLNLENTNKETARRLIDFLSGVAYSIDGNLRKIASNAYVITPNNVDVDDAKLSGGKKAASSEEQTEQPAGRQFGDF